MVLVLCNLKPRNMRGIKSSGMLLAASDAAHENVEPISPPAGAAVGERVWFGDKKEQVCFCLCMTRLCAEPWLGPRYQRGAGDGG